jgi:hypothetical protein
MKELFKKSLLIEAYLNKILKKFGIEIMIL